MSRISRINTIWRKELTDTLRDRRTLLAMILVPIVLYPGLILFSLQGLELQMGRMRQEEYRIAVSTDTVRAWLRQVIDSDPARQPGAAPEMPAEELVEKAAGDELSGPPEPDASRNNGPDEAARESVRRKPPRYTLTIVPDPRALARGVLHGEYQAGLIIENQPPTEAGAETSSLIIYLDETDIRSQMASAGLEGVFERYADELLVRRLKRENLEPAFVQPLHVTQQTVATPEKVGGSILGQIVPLILIVMTITGAIYPAIDLTAGERERGTLETLMVAPVPTVDLIAGKFIVVTLIGMLSALLNLLSIGGTIALGGLGQILTRGSDVVIPLSSLPWVLLVLVPLAVMFSASLLAVCSFARSFKEAQNYVMPVMVAALIPAVLGSLPGMRLTGAMLVVPVTNITLLTRDLFMGKVEVASILWVTLSSTLYAGAAVAVAARLFGQEAVLFADSGSVKTIFRRRFFKPTNYPGTANAFLLLAAVFSLNFFVQQQLLNRPGVMGTLAYWWGLAGILALLFVGLPLLASWYARVRIDTTLSLGAPRPPAVIAAVCFGVSTWVLALAWMQFQSTWMPMPPEMEQVYEQMLALLQHENAWMMVFFVAVMPGICEELFFRGYALSGIRRTLGPVGGVLIVAIAFGLYHFSIHRLIPSAALGVLFGLLVIRFGSIWPAIIAHMLHNTLSVLCTRPDGLLPRLKQLGYDPTQSGYPPPPWLLLAALLTALGIAVCVGWPRARTASQPLPTPDSPPG